jgi:hypothetical protein
VTRILNVGLLYVIVKSYSDIGISKCFCNHSRSGYVVCEVARFSFVVSVRIWDRYVDFMLC